MIARPLNNTMIIEPHQLAEHLQSPHPELRLIDLRGSDAHRQGHIAGAIPLDYAQLVHNKPPVMGLLPDIGTLSRTMSALGVTPDAWVVAYDDEAGGRASRLLWTLDVLGHGRFSLLNGGLQAWLAAGYPLTRKAVSYPSSTYEASLANNAAIADKNYIIAHLGDPKICLLDTRSALEYHGLDQRAQRAGHIPGAVHFDWIQAIDRERYLRIKPHKVLQPMLADLGVTPDKEIIVYCHSHHRSAHTYIVIKNLGYPKIRGYAGAWSEWGNDLTVPIETSEIIHYRS